MHIKELVNEADKFLGLRALEIKTSAVRGGRTFAPRLCVRQVALQSPYLDQPPDKRLVDNSDNLDQICEGSEVTTPSGR